MDEVKSGLKPVALSRKGIGSEQSKKDSLQMLAADLFESIFDFESEVDNLAMAFDNLNVVTRQAFNIPGDPDGAETDPEMFNALLSSEGHIFLITEQLRKTCEGFRNIFSAYALNRFIPRQEMQKD